VAQKIFDGRSKVNAFIQHFSWSSTQGAQEKTLDNARQGEALYKLGIPE
jgi:hypothetical protein